MAWKSHKTTLVTLMGLSRFARDEVEQKKHNSMSCVFFILIIQVHSTPIIYSTSLPILLENLYSF